MDGFVLFSDVVCPWCYLAANRWVQAVAAVETEGIAVEWRFGAFELDPSAPRAGTRDRREFLESKMGAAAVAGLELELEDLAAADGIPMMAWGPVLRCSSFDAHRLLASALTVDPGVHRKLGLALLTAYFADGLDIDDRAVLTHVAVACGMPAARVAETLESHSFAVEIHADQRLAMRERIRGVPALTGGGLAPMEGLQTVDAYADAVRRVLTPLG